MDGISAFKMGPRGAPSLLHHLNQEVGSHQTKPASAFIVDFQSLES